MATKPGIPKGTRDFSPAEMAKRNYIFDTIREVFYTFGFQPIETPAMENFSTLMGKYGGRATSCCSRYLTRATASARCPMRNSLSVMP